RPIRSIRIGLQEYCYLRRILKFKYRYIPHSMATFMDSFVLLNEAGCTASYSPAESGQGGVNNHMFSSRVKSKYFFSHILLFPLYIYDCRLAVRKSSKVY